MSEPSSSRRVVVKRDPFNAETSLTLHRGVITPTRDFYVRNHFRMPSLDVEEWRLVVEGEVGGALRLTYDDIRSLPRRSLVATLECAGNGRSLMQPAAPGEPWQYGAVSTAEWAGVPLHVVLEQAGLRPAVRQLVVEGADRGTVDGRGGPISYARGLEVAKALEPDTLLAYEMNGEPLTVEHGFPVRLIVPGWYGMASVKWVTRLEAVRGSFDGYYQVDRYVLDYPGGVDVEPLSSMRVRSLIVDPPEGAVLPSGDYLVRGYAWSGGGPVERVEVSTDDGASWHPAELTSNPEPHAWRSWEFRWPATGPVATTLRSRAFDATSQQPTTARWNVHGYANNAIQAVDVVVEGEHR